MDKKAEQYFRDIKDKKIAFCGIGRSNLPLISLYKKYGAQVVACDIKTREALGEIAQNLEQNGVELRCGKDYLKNLDVDLFFRTPGMYYYKPELKVIRHRGVSMTGEIETFMELCPCKVYGVTGSDGKTTTASVISEMLSRAGEKVYLGGNIGKPLLPEIESMTEKDCVVAELSSFQLISMTQSPDVAVITNISPNHLDVHSSMEEYVEAKLNILNFQNENSLLVLNEDNDLTKQMKPFAKGKLKTFSRSSKVQNGAYCDKNGDIYIADNGIDTFLMNKEDIFIKGDHNVENYLAAICAVSDRISADDIIKTAVSFGGVEHRIEFVREIDGVKYYNDSIATSPTRTIAGLTAFDKKIILIAGGYDKHIPYEPLAPYLIKYCKALILMGDTADKIEQAVQAYGAGELKIIRVDDMEQAVAKARENAVADDVVSLSPASAGFDKYKDFEERGRHFKSIVKGL